METGSTAWKLLSTAALLFLVLPVVLALDYLVFVFALSDKVELYGSTVGWVLFAAAGAWAVFSIANATRDLWAGYAY